LTSSPTRKFTAFCGDQIIAHGDLPVVAVAAHAYQGLGVLVLDDATGRPVDLDLRGSTDEVAARLSPAPPLAPKPTRGRPRLGVTAREVTLLPRHWEWLASQPGGASAALRRLVDQARRENLGDDAQRSLQEAVYRAMTILAGDRPGYEEAARALFANDRGRFEALTADWPRDIADYIRSLDSEPAGQAG
jgi:hypothetical protein